MDNMQYDKYKTWEDKTVDIVLLRSC
jgi:hypothetical protein